LRAVRPRGPYAFIGACFGATVAYEMARQVLDAGDEVALLGRLDPSGREGGRGDQRMVTLPRFARRTVDSLLFAGLELYRAELRGLTWRERARYAQRKLLGIAGSSAACVGNQVLHHVLRGHDSGDMLNGHNAALVATHLQALLRTALPRVPRAGQRPARAATRRLTGRGAPPTRRQRERRVSVDFISRLPRCFRPLSKSLT
jgi:hypothetical protein